MLFNSTQKKLESIRMNKKIHTRIGATKAASTLLTIVLAGCSSSVPLHQLSGVGTSEQEKYSSSQSNSRSLGSSDALPSRGVSSVELTSTDTLQPKNMSRTVYFDYDSVVIRPEYSSMLEENARYLKADSRRRVSLEGHTDARGGREYNLGLGQKRAETVRRALALLGVKDTQMEPVSFGEEKASANDTTESAHTQNRRVEFNYR